jgi:hypothetical protein
MQHTLIDRGADHDAARFCVVTAPMYPPPLYIETDRGTFRVMSIGRTYTGKLPGQGLVANHYLDVDAAAIGAPTGLTREVVAQRAASQARAKKGLQDWRKAHPKEVAALSRANGERLRAWREANPKKAAAMNQASAARLKAWRAAHPKEVAAFERRRKAGLREYHAKKKERP